MAPFHFGQSARAFASANVRGSSPSDSAVAAIIACSSVVSSGSRMPRARRPPPSTMSRTLRDGLRARVGRPTSSSSPPSSCASAGTTSGASRASSCSSPLASAPLPESGPSSGSFPIGPFGRRVVVASESPASTGLPAPPSPSDRSSAGEKATLRSMVTALVSFQ
ncbi:hypothetical protein GGG16DRAFT_84619 [Schizophyllum commune]